VKKPSMLGKCGPSMAKTDRNSEGSAQQEKSGNRFRRPLFPIFSDVAGRQP
jgi:hypothetical protein